ncbi:D-alanine--D-alanine ligase family protein [Streptomyces jumonjinensis]|uniref:D-alanine--D-alanine ligase family protein n=1 Tax=Streptomyces jumonjinensis TaxID=1945 RepID=UPI0037AC87A7
MTTFLDWNNRPDQPYVNQAGEELRRWWSGRERKPNVALVYGGLSAEDRLYIDKCPPEQLSLNTLMATLKEVNAPFRWLNPTNPGFIQDLAGYDVALSNLHGPFGEDGRLQGLLDYLRVPYCGSGVGASAVASDKVMCKRLMESIGVPTPEWYVWNGGPAEDAGCPVMVKPAHGGSSVGMSLVRSGYDLPVALATASDIYPCPALVEEYIPGVPVTVGLMELPGRAVLVFPPLATEVESADFYDADTKLAADRQSNVTTREAELPPETRTAIKGHARALWNTLDLRGTARVDFIVASDKRIYALEVNTTPDMSAGSNFVSGAELCGFNHADVVLAMLHEAIVRPPYDVPLPVPRFAGGPSLRKRAS